MLNETFSVIFNHRAILGHILGVVLYARREFWIPYGPPAAPFEWGGNQDLAEKADLRHPSAATLAPRKLVSLITSR